MVLFGLPKGCIEFFVGSLVFQKFQISQKHLTLDQRNVAGNMYIVQTVIWARIFLISVIRILVRIGGQMLFRISKGFCSADRRCSSAMSVLPKCPVSATLSDPEG